jgi:hypothetical protein
MRSSYTRMLLCFACCNVFLAIAFAEQKHPSKVDDWPLQNASIGAVEIAAGTSRQMQVTYPAPDGPSFPLKASVTWSMETPVKGISIDKTGKLRRRPAWYNRDDLGRCREGEKEVIGKGIRLPSR